MSNRTIIYIENPATGSHFRTMKSSPKPPSGKHRTHKLPKLKSPIPKNPSKKKPANYSDWHLVQEYPGSNKWFAPNSGVTTPQFIQGYREPDYPKFSEPQDLAGIVWTLFTYPFVSPPSHEY